jgi:hypothetical protein
VNALWDVLNETYDDIDCFPEWFRYGWCWPPHPLDLNLCDYFLFLIDAFYRNNSHAVEELQQEISAAAISIIKETKLQLCEISDIGCR